ncbi:MAG TPA: glycosyltransferase family 4 protein [Gaiellaceae bacterium]|nr:glycosyltransferase family 4 protein [Gaiellaceae bacterium]
MKLVFVTQEVDPDHAALAQTVDLIGALAARVDELAIVARDVEWDGVPANAAVRTFDAAGKLGRGWQFERSLNASLGGADAVLVHMVPQFAVLAAPAVRIRRVPLGLWYTHWHSGATLRAATTVADVVFSVDCSSFPLATPKVRGIGHAIDVVRFAPGPPPMHEGPLRLLALGRTARWKGLATLLDAVSLAVDRGADVQLEIRGPSLTDDELLHRRELERRVGNDDSLRARVAILPPIRRDEIPALIASADLVVSPNEPSSGATLDKAVFEAAACARPVLSTNPAFASLLGELDLPLLAPARDPEALAEAIVALADAGRVALARAGEQLRARVVADHSLDHWADAVIEVLREIRSPRARAGSERTHG